MKMVRAVFRLWLLLLFGAACGYLALFNGGEITLNFHTTRSMWEPEPFTMPIYQAFSMAFLLGALVTTLYFFGEYTKKAFEARRLRRELEDLRDRSPRGSSDDFGSAPETGLSAAKSLRAGDSTTA